MKNLKLSVQYTALASSALLLAACANVQGYKSGSSTGQVDVSRAPMQLGAAQGTALRTCADLTKTFAFAQTKIDSATTVAAGKVGATPAPTGPTTAYDVAEHCLVVGKMLERKGVDGQDYAIGFQMRLPKNWNGRFYYQANGGIDGVVHPALGALGGGPLTGALHQGFAVISTDAGHRGNQNPRFGEDPIARADYGYGAVGKATPMAKALIAAAYGKAPDRSYIGGCSNGGRHALVAASRHSHEFDGYLVGAPGYRLPNAALAQLWGTRQWFPLATRDALMTPPSPPAAPGVRIPDLGTALNAAERQTVANAVLGKCDALDGAKDGLVQDVAACQSAFNLQRDVATCAGEARNGQCLTTAQKSVLAAVQAGGKTPSGKTIYSPFPYDPGIAAANWAQWKFVNSQTLDPAAGYIFMTPPRTVRPFSVDIEDSYNAIYATNAQFKESADAVVSAGIKDQPALMSALRNRGGKVLMYHGVSDAVFSETDTRALVNKTNQAFSGKAGEFMRHFTVPGMAHCTAGPALDQFDALTPLVNWVEKGQAPSSITASARGAGNAGGANPELPKDWSINRSRPLCAYPSVARYKGTGSLEDSVNFSCQ